METIMATQYLMPWNRGGVRRDLPAELDPGNFFTLHREMNRLFDDVFRGFEAPAPTGSGARAAGSWPRLEVEETENEYRIHAELPGTEEKDIEVLLQDGVLVLRGEKRAKVEDKHRAFSERFYGRFERHIPLDAIDEEKVQAAFENGVLTITAPKSKQSRERVRRIQVGHPEAATKGGQPGPTAH
jgi:HSP20 family protein